jgi:hypothetical protein
MKEYAIIVETIAECHNIEADSLESAYKIVQAMIDERKIEYKDTDIIMSELKG